MTDAWICDAVRTPIGRYGGSLSGVRADDLAALPIAALLERQPNLDPALIDDVILGCANQAGEDNRNVARMAVLLSGLPVSVPGATVNRLCGSGMNAIGNAADAIRVGGAQMAVAGGVESMSRAPFVLGKSSVPFDRSTAFHDTTLGWRFVNRRIEEQYGVDSMAETAENVAAEFGISREDQDAFALRSQQKAQAAAESGRLAEEIVAVEVPRRRQEPLIVKDDEHPRANSTLEGLASLKPIVKKDGCVTAGNASGINDGACAVLLASTEAVALHGLEPLARIVAWTSAGVAPRVMGIGPVPATQKLLKMTGLRMEQLDVIELNEAFAAQGLAVLRELGIPDDAGQVNPNGGAIALGHPFGCSGARITGTLLNVMRQNDGTLGIATMCVGLGQGITTVIERL